MKSTVQINGLQIHRPIMLVATIVAILLMAQSSVSALPPTGGSVSIDSPSNGTTVTGPITISGTYSSMYQIVIAFNAGTIYSTHMVDPNGDDDGAWSYDWDPTGYSGNVEIAVRGFALSDRYFRWANYVNVTVDIPQYEPPTVSIVTPNDGDTASGTTPITVAASDTQGLSSSVQVRVDWGAWQTASPSGGNYVYNWDTSGLGDKTHAIEARATDTDGNVTRTATNYVKTGGGTNEPFAVKHSDRALWLWEPAAYELLENAGARNVLKEFMTDTGLTTIYFYADSYPGTDANSEYLLVENPALYRSFISWAHTEGYDVHALLASSFYVAPMYAYERYHDKAIELMENVINYNISSAANERFDGVNIDIEPHGLPEWPDGTFLQGDWITMLDKMMDRKAASGLSLYTGPAIPRWLDLNGECRNVSWGGSSKWCSEHIQDVTDYIAIMDYRDVAGGPSGIIKHAEGEIAYGNSIGKKVAIGIETDWISLTGDPEKISFQEEGRDHMENELAQVYSAFNSDFSFLGIAVHHYDADRLLPSKWAPGGTFWQTTVSDSANPGAPGNLTAATWDWQSIALRWDRSSDDVQLDYYEIHRSTTSGFTPGASTLARTTIFNFTNDWGLLANTTYYYKIIAVDLAGNKSSVSTQASATTDTGVGLAPMHIDTFTVDTSASPPSATIKIVDGGGSPISGVNVFGAWFKAAGKHIDSNTGADGTTTFSAEVFEDPDNYIVEAVPSKILADGYYWAYSQDVVHTAEGSKGGGGGGGAMHVSNIVVVVVNTSGPWYRGEATVTIVDSGGAPVSGATVDASYSGTTSGTASGVTGGSGNVTLVSSNKKNGGTWTFCVDNVTNSGWTYDSGANVETCDTGSGP